MDTRKEWNKTKTKLNEMDKKKILSRIIGIGDIREKTRQRTQWTVQDMMDTWKEESIKKEETMI